MVIRKIMALLLLLPFVLYCPDEEATKEQANNKDRVCSEDDRSGNRTEKKGQDPTHCLEPEPKEHTYTFRFKLTYVTIPECWPKKNIQTTLTKPD